ncbi:hypothetical protein HYG77_09800 [Rhodococcus sp. ZPP]|nr:hypothetical protein HYG77_09800 [Rhodococcus sp. ZPP]
MDIFARQIISRNTAVSRKLFPEAATTPIAGDLADTLGIRTEDPHGVVTTRISGGRAETNVGQLVSLDGIIYVFPRHDLTTRQAGYLAAAAEDAFYCEANAESGWVPVVLGNELGWATTIIVSKKVKCSGVRALNRREG